LRVPDLELLTSLFLLESRMRNERRMSGSARGEEKPTAARLARRSSPTLHLRFDGLHERKRKLKALIQSKGWLLFCDHIEEHGDLLHEIVCKNDLEGIVCKPNNSPYQFTETHTYWLKLKNPYYTQAMGQDDLFAPPGKKSPKPDWAGCAIACVEADL